MRPIAQKQQPQIQQHINADSRATLNKQRLYNALHNQFARLQTNMSTLERQIETTSEQLKQIQNFGISQAAIFMASQRVFRVPQNDDATM
ncbi:9969_t:CDS:2 [Paraglomus brasilianum]|uniref:9969_t:CDS:1 n=1 Tax=Paraglomus brasilianum TaxID=144538 RepID=A0A9N9AVH8_9GLOM|nr:9969_t:CDS:2 [Paraglomus brasilianum]